MVKRLTNKIPPGFTSMKSQAATAFTRQEFYVYAIDKNALFFSQMAQIIDGV